ncbi:hypothetical protein AB0I60_19750 [Actinosynnema sp. NPDC050436]|uniref:hypothetical protein n=1 Tax=Actinosynnema sp. NPDC050436 TaxID=3155659 RepID=UPI0034095EAB
MKKNRLLSALSALVAVPTLVLSLTGTAHAADGWQPTVDASDSGPGQTGVYCAETDGLVPLGYGCFVSYGEWFWLRDENANNSPVAISWLYESPDGDYRSGVIYNSLGKARGWTNLNKSFEENGRLTITVCEVTSIANETLSSGTCGVPHTDIPT